MGSTSNRPKTNKKPSANSELCFDHIPQSPLNGFSPSEKPISHDDSDIRQKRNDNKPSAEPGFDGALFSGAFFNLSTTVVGVPAAVKQLGLVPGLIMIVLGALLTESSIDMILRFTRASKTSSYSGLVSDSSRNFLQGCIVVNNLGMFLTNVTFDTNFILSLTWQLNQLIHPIENELIDPTEMKSIVRTSLTFCSSVYVATSFFGFLMKQWMMYWQTLMVISEFRTAHFLMILSE